MQNSRVNWQVHYNIDETDKVNDLCGISASKNTICAKGLYCNKDNKCVQITKDANLNENKQSSHYRMCRDNLDTNCLASCSVENVFNNYSSCQPVKYVSVEGYCLVRPVPRSAPVPGPVEINVVTVPTEVKQPPVATPLIPVTPTEQVPAKVEKPSQVTVTVTPVVKSEPPVVALPGVPPVSGPANIHPVILAALNKVAEAPSAVPQSIQDKVAQVAKAVAVANAPPVGKVLPPPPPPSKQ